MQRLCLILLPALVLAAGSLSPVTVLHSENTTIGSDAVVRMPARPAEPAHAQFIVGAVDTIGGTTFDWQANGPIYRFLATAPGFGIHATWMWSAEMSGTSFTDRNMRYNYYGFASGEWAWIDPDYMQSGQNVYAERSGFGSLDADPTTGVVLVSRHTANQTPAPMHPDVARDIAPGAGIFEYAEGTPILDGYQWPPISVGQNSTIHMFLITATYQLAYTRIVTWPTFEAPVPGQIPDPGFPTHNIAASKVSQKVCLVWENSTATPSDAYYTISQDGGTTWGPVEQLLPPPAFSGDSIPSFHIASMFPFYDRRRDNLHIVAAVNPIINDTSYIIPAEIWHWCPDNSPEWSKVHRAGCDPFNLQAPVGYNALYACRPSIGEDRYGGLYVTWEQFDSSNVEPTTQFLRAGVFYAQDGGDNGQTWLQGVQLTDRTTGSHRFPSVIDYITDDSLYVIYEIDGVAGFYVQGQGAVTENPIIVQSFPVNTGIAAGPDRVPTTLEFSAPNPVRGAARLEYALPRAGAVRLEVFDLSGRQTAMLQDGQKSAGRYSAVWLSSNARPGVYLARLTASGQTMTRKLVLTE